MIKTYRGAELYLQHYKGKSVVDYGFEILDVDGVALDLPSRYSLIVLEFYAKRNGTLIDTFNNNSGLTYTTNTITWNASKVRMDVFRLLTYYHHCYGVIKTAANLGQHDVLFFGPSQMI